MPKYYRGDVIEVLAPAGKDETGKTLFKPRPVVVWKDFNSDANIITVYCTSQNKGDEANSILVLKGSHEALRMGLTKDTYIMPTQIKFLPDYSIKRKIGRCSLIQEIQIIVDRWSLRG